MKSEERHELQRNDLAEAVTGLPALWAKHGNKVLLGVAAILLVFTALRYRNGQAVQRTNETRQALANAWSGVQQVRRLAELPASTEIDKMRGPAVNDVNQAVQVVLDDSSATPTQAAWAWLARGEMYWLLAQGRVDNPTTAPASQPSEDYNALAANAYGKVVTDYAAVTEPTLISRFALAALSENRRDAADARKQYDAIVATPGVPDADKALAEARIGMLASVEKPMLMLPATQPASTPAIDLPSLSPSLQFGPLPATRPSR